MRVPFLDLTEQWRQLGAEILERIEQVALPLRMDPRRETEEP